MKKFIAIALILGMALSLCACGKTERYPELADMLDAGDYEGAVMHIYDLYQNAQTGEGEEGGEAGGSNNEVTEPARPTEDDWDVLREYYNTLYSLCSYANDGYISYWDDENDVSYSGSAALAVYYDKLQALDKSVIDKWVDTEYCGTNYFSGYNNEGVNWDYESVLANFSKLDNVLLEEIRTTTDNMENVKESYDNPTWKYNEDGSVLQVEDASYAFELVESNPWNLYGTQDVTFDDAGKAIKIKYMSGDNTNAIVDITYDASGNKINDHIKTNDGEWDIQYEYDSQNRLVKIEMPSSWDSSKRYVWNYTYDASGNMVKEEKIYISYSSWAEREFDEEKWIKEYTYDANGALVSGTYKYEDWSYESNYNNGSYTFTQYIYCEKLDQYSFTSDDQGRPLTMTVVYGDTVYVHGDNAGEVYDTPDYVSMVVDFVYGDYWFYNVG